MEAAENFVREASQGDDKFADRYNEWRELDEEFGHLRADLAAKTLVVQTSELDASNLQEEC